jgi:signal transduction histidine kinase
VDRSTVTKVSDEAAECRRLAELLDLDVVGIVREAADRTRTSWWASAGSGPRPLDLGAVLEGRVPDWVAFPRGEDVVFAHVAAGTSVRSVQALSAMLASLTGGGTAPQPASQVGGVAPEDPIQRERARLAYAIHDGLTQIVTASVLELEWLSRKADVDPATAVDALSEAATELRRALNEIRSILNSLSPQEPGTEEPLEELLAAVMERWQLPASWSIEGDLAEIPAPILDAASSVIRECVANAAKHSESREVAVHVHTTRDAMEVQVEDHGRGFEPAAGGLAAGHLGLEMMRRRVEEVHGTLDVESAPGRGTRVVARLPVGQGDNP